MPRIFPAQQCVLVALAVLLSAYPLFAQESLVPVTTRFAVSKKVKHHNYRLQLFPKGDSVTVLGFGFTRLTKSLKQLKFNDLGKVKRSALIESSITSLDSIYKFNTSPGQSLGFKVLPKSEFERQKLQFTAGRHASAYFSNQWIKFITLPVEQHQDLSFETRGTFKRHHQYVMDMLPGAYAWEIPALDPWRCEPAVLEFIKLRKLQGYGTDKIKYSPYQLTSRMIVRNSFEVYFPLNDIKPDQSAINRLIQYLDQNAYVILNAELEGGCSIEGSAERNLYLQQQRAKILRQTLYKYSDELIKKDTILLTDEIQQFRELLKKDNHKHQWLDTLSDERLREMINKDEKLKKELEPIFVLQRKASLKVVLAKRLTREEQFSKFANDLDKALSSFHTNKATHNAEGEHKVMGMLDKLFSDYENKYMTAEEVEKIIKESSYPDYVFVLIGYHILKKFEDKSWPKNKRWEGYWADNNLADWLNTAQLSLLNLLQDNPSKEKRTKYLRMLTDFQTYNFLFVDMGLIETQSLCNIPYSQEPDFLGLILSQYAYLFEKSQSSDLGIQCIPQHKVSGKKDSTFNVDLFIDQALLKNGTKTYSLIGNHLIKNKSFDMSPKGAYYFLLKQHFLKNNKNILDNVTTASNANVELNVFNLWHLLSINVENWNPMENFFYDEEVQVDEMSRLVSMMQGMDKHLCRPQVNALYLNFHLKMLYYLQNFQEAGNGKHVKYAEASMKYITNYYKSRAQLISPKLSMHLVKQFNLFNWLPGNQNGAINGYEILSAVSKERILRDDELKLYSHYLKLYNPEMKKISPLLNDKEKLISLMNEPY